MRDTTRTLIAMLCLLMAALGAASGQSVKVSPVNPSVGLGKTIQFSAQVTGEADTSVTWSAGGTPGGTAAAGAISPTGLYTAPAIMPGQNPVQITATCTADPKARATTYVILLTAAPVITSVAPNPLAVGTITVTIQGSGFLPGATVIDTYGSNPAIQLSNVSVTPTTVVATGYQGPAATAAFAVKNPGSEYSNTITVPVTGAKPGNLLTVINGSGSGTYAEGTVVTITAKAPPAGQVFAGWTGAAVQNPGAVQTTLVMPAGGATVTANYAVPGAYQLTVVGGSGGGAYLPGTVVTITANAAPAGQVFSGWTGAPVQDSTSAVTTITMPSAPALVTANYAAIPVTIPFPVTTHPRLWVTQQDLPRLQSWAVSTNAIYQQGMIPLLNKAVSDYNTIYFPNGVPNPNYPDPGDTQGYGLYVTEQHGLILAFNSLIDPNPASRIMYAKYARNLLMYVINQAAQGHLAGAPFRDPLFAVYNRGNGSGEYWPLIVDWIYSATDSMGNPILTAADKAAIRNVFMMWANDCLNASTTGGDHPSPIGATNSVSLLPGNRPYRMASNNYYLGHARLLTMMSLVMDPADDPVVNGLQPPSQLGNTLRSYIPNATGAWLYQEFAMMGDPAAVASAYGIPGGGAGFGLASGGLPPEGMLYGHSFAYVMGQLLALQTAGFNTPANSGPQIGLIGAPVWDRYVTGLLSSLTPTASIFPSQPWLGPVYQYGSYGDLLRLWASPDFMQPMALMTILEQQNGQSTHASAARWFATNGVEGGAGKLLSRVSQSWSWGVVNSVLYYLLMDPAAASAPDPRPTFPTIFYDKPAGRVVAHSDWSANNTMFDYRASWISINHQLGDGGQFELYRNGEWLTKEMSNYDNNVVGLTTVYHNTLALQNWSANGTPNLSWFETGEWANGSQWILGANAGDPTTVTSSGPGYLYITSDLTKLYNKPNFWTPNAGAVDITQATRSILWLNNDYIVVYDRATSQHAGLFKRFHMSVTNAPAISGNTVTETLNSGQQLFVQTLLPAGASITSAFAAGNLNPIAQLEPTRYILTVEDPAKPSDVRFLHVLQGADVGTLAVPAALQHSLTGTPFDGASFGSTSIYFPVSTAAAIQATTFSVGSAVHTVLVTGLAPNTAYDVTVQPAFQGSTVTVTPGGAGAVTDGAGLLRVTL